MKLNFQHSFTDQLPADPIKENTRRQVTEAAFSYVDPTPTKAPEIVHVAPEVAQLLGLTKADTQSEAFLKIFSGNQIPTGSQPFAMVYGGHQFGNWAGQLGDGRAINLGEIVHDQQRWTLQLKGAGPTPYSRSADGLAVLRSSIREHLCSEAMYHLGVPTTRSLSLMLTGDSVLRDMMYNGNTAYEKGAVVCRVAPNFIRFGSFQIFAARGDHKNLKRLTDYTIKTFFPEIKKTGKAAYLALFKIVSERTLAMIIDWQRVGFVHGVMNTDNMSISGLTIDYGPYGWLEGYDPGWTPNTTDRQQKRYRYGQQPDIGLWNLYQLANALYPLIEETEPLEEILKNYQAEFTNQFPAMIFAKLGLTITETSDLSIITALENALISSETDMTIFFRLLANFNAKMIIDEAGDFLRVIRPAFYDPDAVKGEVLANWIIFFNQYQKQLTRETRHDDQRKSAMNGVNPKYVLRNYMAQLAIDAADEGDYSLVSELYDLLKKPYDEQPEMEKWFAKRPEWARHKVGCSMLSCSS